MTNFDIFNEKIVLVTGHTGFKGSWLSAWLGLLGAKVVGVSNALPSDPCNYQVSSLDNVLKDNRIDILDEKAIHDLIIDIQPDFIFHLAAQALVRPSYEKPVETFLTNAIGSANILEALRSLEKSVTAVMITSDKAYDNVEWNWGYRETDNLGGKDPYSASKGMAELAIKSYVESYFNSPNSNIRIGITRAGNVIGGGDWAVDRIVPDCMMAWSENNVVDVRSPLATRPWQHVLEPLSGYLALATELFQRDSKHGEAYNFGPTSSQNRSVGELINEMSKYWENVRWNDISKSSQHVHEAGLLKLNCDKALADLNWLPTLEFEETVRFTVEWYKEYYKSPQASMYSFTKNQISEYVDIAENRSISWASKINKNI